MIEKMSLLNIISKRDEMGTLFRKIVSSSDFHQIEARKGIEATDFEEEKLPTSFLGKSKKLDFDMRELDSHYKTINRMISVLGVDVRVDKSVVDSDKSIFEVYEKLDVLSEKITDILDQKERLLEEKKKMERFGSIDEIRGIDFDIKKLRNLDNFIVYIGAFATQDEKRIKMNYENMQLIIMPIARRKDERIYLVITPIDAREESEALLRSLLFKEIDVDWSLFGTPEETIENYARLNEKNKNDLMLIDESISSFIESFEDDIIFIYSRLKLEYELIAIKKKCYFTDYFFWFSAYVPEDKIDEIKELVGYEAAKLIILDIEDKELDRSRYKIPTRLKNSKFFRPFEMLVNMYGVPSYYEKDPTSFVAISYMLLFGAMFGDVGQGLLIFLAGIFIVKRNKSSGSKASAGALLYSIGASSMVFGFIYDSFFGIEHFISHFVTKIVGSSISELIFIRPIDNTDIILISAIVLGIIFTLLSFILSAVNKLSSGNIKEGLFGKNGINGMVMFVAFLLTVVFVVLDFGAIYTRISVSIIVLTAAFLVFREPLANLIKNKTPLHDEEVSEYYIESFFELFEAVLGILSNSVSFIRVGAFALNHVGLFVAFHTMAKIINNTAGDITLFILGNALVIGLEGLIVFIQGLRLIYYEMFSKYFEGEGVVFDSEGEFNEHREVL